MSYTLGEHVGWCTFSPRCISVCTYILLAQCNIYATLSAHRWFLHEHSAQVLSG